MASTQTTTLTITLHDGTTLAAAKYTIYVLGFTTKSQKMLSITKGTKTATFIPVAANSGTLPAYKLNDEILEVQVNIPAPFPDSAKIDGARIYFFVADNSIFKTAPAIAYSNKGANVTNVLNPPNSTVPPYSFCEFTIVDPGYGSVIDVQTVDGFTLPVTITLNQGGAVGQPLDNPGVTRSAIINAYAPFITALGNTAAPFLKLQYAQNSGGLLNPGLYLGETDTTNQLLHLDSTLNGWFDADLTTLFSNTKLSIQGVGGGTTILPDVYTVTSTAAQTVPGSSSLKHAALQFTGSTNKQVFTVFNPVGLCTMSFHGSAGAVPITGVLDNATLTFTTPLPPGTDLQVGMFVTGAGVDPNKTTIQTINKTSGIITSVVLTGSILTGKTPTAQFGFSKAPGMFMTSGAMVFGNAGVFAFAPGLNADQQAVLLNLQNQMVSALNRGVANLAPTSGSAGYTSQYWGTQTNWYPANTVQNLFSLFMHTATVAVTKPVAANVPIFIQAPGSTTCARGTTMGQAYGFAYDENAGPIPPAPTGQPEVPSKYDPLPVGTTGLTVTLGAWG